MIPSIAIPAIMTGGGILEKKEPMLLPMSVLLDAGGFCTTVTGDAGVDPSVVVGGGCTVYPGTLTVPPAAA
jgi:uncharacterized membrane protein YqiK